MNQEITRKNLKFFRKENGLSLAKLGEIRGFSKSTISEYESGKKTITADSALNFADYFEIEYADFVSCDFEEMEKTEIGSESFYENLALFLPIVKSELALKNTAFKKTVEKHEKIYDSLKKMNPNSCNPAWYFNDIQSCAGEYLGLKDDPNCTGEAAVNYLGLILFLELWMSSFRKLIESIDYPNIMMNKLEENSPELKIRLEGADEEEKKKAKLVTEIFSGAQFKDGINDLIKFLKQSPQWKDIGDYYIAMRYVWGSVENDLSPGMNYRIGSEMLQAFADVGNPYAAAILNL